MISIRVVLGLEFELQLGLVLTLASNIRLQFTTITVVLSDTGNI